MSKQAAKVSPWRTAARRVCEVNNANGWDQPTQPAMLNKIMLTVTELDEAVRSEEDPVNDPLEEELADVAVRLLHVLESIWPGEWALRGHEQRRLSIHQPLPVLLWPILRQLCSATEAWRNNNRPDQRIALEMALGETRILANALDFSLLDEVRRKAEKNAGRGLRHGRANPAG